MRCLAVFAGACFGLGEALGLRVGRLQPLARLASESFAAGQFTLAGLHCFPGMLRGVVALGELLALVLRGLPFLLQLLAARLPGGQLFLRLPRRVVGLRGGGSCLFGGAPPLAQLPGCLARVPGECRDAGERSQRTGDLGGGGSVVVGWNGRKFFGQRRLPCAQLGFLPVDPLRHGRQRRHRCG